MWSKNLKNKKGFTLVEIIVVLIILAIRAAFAIPTYLGYVENSKILMDESTVGLLNRTTQAWRTSHHQNDPGNDPYFFMPQFNNKSWTEFKEELRDRTRWKTVP